MKINLVLGVSILFVALSASVIDRKFIPTDDAPCSVNAATAYADVIVMIDTSANMGAANLKKIATTLTLALSKFTIGNMFDISKGQRNTRVSVVTYDAQATIAANFTNINSINDLSNVLNGLTVSTSQVANLYDAMAKSFFIKTNCTDLFNCSICYTYMRPTAYVLFAAVANSPNLQTIPEIVVNNDFFDDGTFITINFNTADQTLTTLLQKMTFDQTAKDSMYNFTSASNTLPKDLEWAILQANCYCGAVNGIPVTYYDQKNSRYSKYGECMELTEWGGEYPNSTLDMCAWGTERKVPAYILTSGREKFLSNVWAADGAYPFYIGLHKNQQSQWSWYDYDRSEFKVSGFTDWAQGYPTATGNCGVIDSTDRVNFVWKNYGCNTEGTGLALILCQSKACDAGNANCWDNFNDESCTFDVGAVKKNGRKHIRKMKMINGKPVRIH